MNIERDVLSDVNQYLLGIYHHSQGESNQDFRDRCCDALKKIIDFNHMSWQIKSEQPVKSSHVDMGVYDANKGSYYPSLERSCKIENSGVYHVITLFGDIGRTFSAQDKYLFEYVLVHMATSFRLNIFSLFNQGLHNNIDRAVCNENGKVIEAEEGFYQQLMNKNINCSTTVFKLSHDCVDKAYFIHQSNVTFYTTKKFGYHYLELDRSINDFSVLTNKQKEVCYLLKKSLPNEAIATQLKSSKKTVENHLSAIYEKLAIQSRGSLVSALNK